MSKAKYPRIHKEEAIKSFAKKVENVAGSLEELFKVRQERMQAQIKLIQACKTDAEIQHYKDIGILNSGNDNFLSAITTNR
jgi:hypothetical protein